MRISLFTPLLLATGVLAAPVFEKRDVTVTNDVSIINRVVSSVQNKLGDLKRSLDLLTRAPPGYDLTQYQRDIEKHARDITTAMNNGALDIRRGPGATLMEAAGLMSTVSNLQTATTAATNAWIAAKNSIVRTQGGREAAIRMLTDHKAAAGAFSDALVSQLPAGGLGQEVGRLFSVPSMNAVNQALDAYRRP